MLIYRERRCPLDTPVWAFLSDFGIFQGEFRLERANCEFRNLQQNAICPVSLPNGANEPAPSEAYKPRQSAVFSIYFCIARIAPIFDSRPISSRKIQLDSMFFAYEFFEGSFGALKAPLLRPRAQKPSTFQKVPLLKNGVSCEGGTGGGCGFFHRTRRENSKQPQKTARGKGAIWGKKRPTTCERHWYPLHCTRDTWSRRVVA